LPGEALNKEVHPSATYANNLKAGGSRWPLSIGRNVLGLRAFPANSAARGFSGTAACPSSWFSKTWKTAMTIDEIIEQYDVTREQVKAVIDFAARSNDTVSS